MKVNEQNDLRAFVYSMLGLHSVIDFLKHFMYEGVASKPSIIYFHGTKRILAS